MTFTHRFQELTRAVEECIYTTANQTINENDAMAIAQKSIRKANSDGGIVYVIGNGGSAGIASHFSNDLMKALQISSQTLYDSNLMTCLSNDIGYDQVFSYPLERLLRPQDLLVAISSSGQSQSILKAVDVARSKKVPVITLSGFSSSNPLRLMGFLNFWIDRADYGLVETAHFFLLHALIDTWNKHLSPMVKNVTISHEFNLN